MPLLQFIVVVVVSFSPLLSFQHFYLLLHHPLPLSIVPLSSSSSFLPSAKPAKWSRCHSQHILNAENTRAHTHMHTPTIMYHKMECDMRQKGKTEKDCECEREFEESSLFSDKAVWCARQTGAQMNSLQAATLKRIISTEIYLHSQQYKNNNNNKQTSKLKQNQSTCLDISAEHFYTHTQTRVYSVWVFMLCHIVIYIEREIYVFYMLLPLFGYFTALKQSAVVKSRKIAHSECIKYGRRHIKTDARKNEEDDAVEKNSYNVTKTWMMK